MAAQSLPQGRRISFLISCLCNGFAGDMILKTGPPPSSYDVLSSRKQFGVGSKVLLLLLRKNVFFQGLLPTGYKIWGGISIGPKQQCPTSQDTFSCTRQDILCRNILAFEKCPDRQQIPDDDHGAHKHHHAIHPGFLAGGIVAFLGKGLFCLILIRAVKIFVRATMIQIIAKRMDSFWKGLFSL